MLSPFARLPVCPLILPTGQPANRPTGQLPSAFCQPPSAFCRLPTAYCPLPTGRTAGQSTIELSILVAIVVVALVTMSIYLRRAYQGYARAAVSGQSVQFDPIRPFGSSAPSQEFQFDPTQPYSEAFQLSNVSLGQDIQILTGQAAVDLFAGDPRLPSTPGGTLPGRTLATKVHVVNSWDLHQDAHYEAK